MRHIIIPIRSHGEDWLGGVNYFRSLIRALRRHPSNDFRVSILTNHPGLFGEHERDGLQIIQASWLDPMARPDFFVNAAIKTSGLIHPYLYNFARKSDAALVTHAMSCRFNPCKTIFWMPDFQHCHLPENFSIYERVRRNRNIQLAACRGGLLFSSYSAVSDFRHFYPNLSDVRPYVLQFAPLIEDSHAATEINELKDKYELPERYFYLPNQFWRHKNHIVVLEALQKLPDSIKVVCTGALFDSRGDKHLQILRQTLERKQLRKRFIILGVIPRADFLGLLRHSTCLLNPSLFEGWSTTVEEAKYFRKRMILSDIPVHREQASKLAAYFPPTNANALASEMLSVINTSLDDTPSDFESDQYNDDVRRFASQYWKMATDALSIA